MSGAQSDDCARPRVSGDRLAAGDLDSLTYENLVGLLEDLTERLSSGGVGIEEAADLYESAKRVHAAAAERLERVRTRIEALASEEGRPS